MRRRVAADLLLSAASVVAFAQDEALPWVPVEKSVHGFSLFRR